MCFKNHKYRSVCLSLVFFIALTGLFFRLLLVQIIKHNEFKRLAAQQHDIVIEIPPARGRIYDRCNRPLARNLPVSSLYACPRRIFNRKNIVSRLSPIIDSKTEDLDRILKKDKGFVWVKRHLNNNQAAQIKELNLRELGLLKESRRVYPNGSLAGPLIGFTDIDNNGLEGLELYYNEYLKGSPGKRYSKRDAASRNIISLDEKYIPAQDGQDLVLTIDQVVQHTTEKYLFDACQKYNAPGGMAVVMVPATGEILAMANYHSAAPKDPSLWRNKVVTDFFEPGSVFKMITAAAALEEKTVSMDDRIYCENGVYHFGRRILHDHHPYKWLNFPEVIQKSSNIGTVKIAQSLGKEKFYEYIKKFGFGSLSGIDLPGEVPGRLRPVEKWSKIAITSLPMGQGIAVNALQLACAINVIANKGLLVKPRIVKAIRHKSGHVIKEFDPVIIRRVVSAQTAVNIKDILSGVVASGTGTRARIQGIKVAGKTGTAQKVDPNGQYSHSRFTASFMGFLPADDPVITIVVIVDEPRPVYYGGTVSAPVFKNIARDLQGYFDLRFDENMTFIARKE